MLHDLMGHGQIADEAHFIVIGAGTVGLPTTVLLAQKTGCKVICLESGGLQQDTDIHPLNDVVHRAMPYNGATHGRFRCLGGTSTRWGGALIPFQDADLRNAGWPIGIDELTPFISEVEALFGLEAGPYIDPAFPFDLGEQHVNRLAKWPPFKKRNVAALLDVPVRTDPRISVWLNAHTVDIRVSRDGIVVAANSSAGDRIEVRGRKLIVAAGAIETTRLALLIDRQNDGVVSTLHPEIGCYFTDHISTEVAEVKGANRSLLNRIIGFRFGRQGSMRNIRFELAPAAAARLKLPPSFTHIGFEVDKWSGFDVLREIFRNVQRRKLPPFRVAVDLLRNAPWLARAIWWRFVELRLLFPPDTRLFVHTVIEQRPVRENRIQLSETETDQFGLPLAEISWTITDADKKNLTDTAALFRETWESTGFAKLGRLELFDPRKVWAALDHGGGIYHPTGSTRMGTDPASGVVDRDLRLFGLPQVQLLATSVLPTGGGANPTMMLLLLALRCVDQHRRAQTSLS